MKPHVYWFVRFCRPCLDADPARVITMKPPARKSSRKKMQRDYAGLNAGNEADPSRFLRMMEGKVIKRDPFARMPGSEVGIEWLESDEGAMKEPILVETEEGLGMKMPPAGFTVDDVVEALGEDYPVEVIGACAYMKELACVYARRSTETHVSSHFPLCRRCCNAVKYPELDAGQMARVLEYGALEARQNSQCYLPRDIGHTVGGQGPSAKDCARAGLGGKVLAKHQERTRPQLSKSPAILSHGRWRCVDRKSPRSVWVPCGSSAYLRIGTLTLRDPRYTITSCTGPRYVQLTRHSGPVRHGC